MEEFAPKPPISLARLEANRRNAKRSTGPRTVHGKRRSRRNALRHGILGSALLITEGEIEDAAEFRELLNALDRDLAPVGSLEEVMVEKIAVSWWRLKRALRFEARLIARESAEESLAAHKVHQELRAMLDERERKVRAQAFREAGIQMPEIPGNGNGVEPSPPCSLEEYNRKQDALIESCRIECFNLPTEKDLNRILRYETSLHRQLAHAMNQLERLQRFRKGEHVPAPVQLEIAAGD